MVNPVLRRVAGRLPDFALLTYVGRKSARRYTTPINVFEHDGTYVFALTYGHDVQWLKNVLAAGSCEIRTRGRNVRLVDPELFEDPSRRFVSAPARFILRLTNVTEFVRMRAAG